MPFQYTFRSDDIQSLNEDARDLLENRDRELELYSTTIDDSFLNLNASNLTLGTVPSARMTGAYTGITGLGTLTSLTIDGPLSPSVFFGDWNQDNQWSGIRGTQGYLLTGNSAGDPGVFLRSESVAHPIHIGSNNTNTLTVTNTSATVAGTMFATIFSGALSGNASTATNLSTDRNNWSSNGTISAVVGQLAWKNYGNSHTIFDASNSTSPQGGAVNNTNAQVAWSATHPTLMGWNGGNTFGVRVDSARIADIASSVGTLTSLTVDGPSSASIILQDWNQSPSYSAIQGSSGYLLVGNNVGDSAMYLRTNTAGPVNIGALNSSTLSVGNGTSNFTGEIYATSNIRISTAGANFVAQSPTTSAGFAAQWLSVFGLFILIRNTSTREDKENLQPLNDIVTPNMVDDINIELWNRKGADGMPEIGPMAEDMDSISPFLSIKGMDCDEDGNIIATAPGGINQNGWLSLLTLSIQDCRRRLQQLETILTSNK